jgi:hypothetical protein
MSTMNDVTAPTRSPLLPDRHPIQDFFICDVTDAIPKDDMGSMEHPIFSLSTKPDGKRPVAAVLTSGLASQTG